MSSEDFYTIYLSRDLTEAEADAVAERYPDCTSGVLNGEPYVGGMGEADSAIMEAFAVGQFLRTNIGVAYSRIVVEPVPEVETVPA